MMVPALTNRLCLSLASLMMLLMVVFGIMLVFDITDKGALLVFGITNDVANGCLWHHACL